MSTSTVKESKEPTPPLSVLRETRGTCPECLEPVPARVIEQAGEVHLEKNCPEHGDNRVLLSESPAYFKELMGYYFDVMPESLPQKDYILRLTHRCNMACPICLASSDEYKEQEMKIEQVRELMDMRPRGMKLDLMGAEPTLWPDLEQLIREASKRGHITALHTNGINISKDEDLKRLIDAGLDEVHLQFDGFEDAHDMVLRGQPMGAMRRKILDVLERHDVATDLVVTLMQGLNEDQMLPVLDYAAQHKFVKEVFYLGCRRLGRASEEFATATLAPDQVIDQAERRSNGLINRHDLRVFNKLYFAMLSMFRLRKCFYIHHYMVLRTADGKGGYRPVSDYIDMPYLEPHLDRYRADFVKNRAVAAARLLPHIGLAMARKRGTALLVDGAILPVLLKMGFNLSKIQSRIILLGFITACDPWMHDEQVAANCGKGEFSTDLGVHPAGADANVGRERLHMKAERVE